MTMTPIHRLPLDSEVPLVESIALENLGAVPIERALGMLTDHDLQDATLSITLDWAAQIRDMTGYDWGVCIRYAQIAFYG